MYTTDGVLIKNMDEIESGGQYVVVANNDPLIRGMYNRLQIKPTTSHQRGLHGHTLSNAFLKKIRPVSKRGFSRPQTSMRSQVVSDGMESKPQTPAGIKFSFDINL